MIKYIGCDNACQSDDRHCHLFNVEVSAQNVTLLFSKWDTIRVFNIKENAPRTSYLLHLQAKYLFEISLL